MIISQIKLLPKRVHLIKILPMIKIYDLHKKPDAEAGLNGVTCEIADGETVSLIGPSGSGKSALLKCINGLCGIESGRIIIDGTDISASSEAMSEARMRMGMIFRTVNLFEHITVIENLMLAPITVKHIERKTAYDEGMQLLKRAGLAQKALSYPSELTDGQKQRAAIMRALAMKPRILLFDEPTAQVGPTMRDEVMDLILSLRKSDMTMIIAAHELKFAQDISDSVYFMENGVIVEKGAPKELFTSPKTESARIFIKHLRQFEYTVTAHDFDFADANSLMAEFAHTHFFTKKQTRDLQLMFEELCVQTILPRLTDPFKLVFAAAYQDSISELEISVRYLGARFDPFSEDDALSVTIVKKLSSSATYSYDEETGENSIKIVI